MKFRLTALIILLIFSFFLAACSLAEDITPPPGYQSPTSPPTLGLDTQTPEAAPTITPTATLDIVAGTATPGGTPAGTQSVTPFLQVSPTSTAPVMTIGGKVTNASSTPLTGNLTANLYLYNTGSGTVDQTLTSVVQPTGQYQFTNVPADVKTTYFVMVEYSGVTYTSNPATYDGTVITYDLPIILYDVTDDLNTLSLNQVHMQFDFSVQGKVQARMLYIVINPGPKSVIVSSDGTSIPFIQIPVGASEVQYEVAQGSATLVNATNGFAMLPGADKQYGIFATFSFPYTNNLKLTQSFSLPVTSETVIVPEGVRVRSNQLKDAGTQAFQGITYHLYQGGSLASGGTLALTISGKPGDSTGFSLNRQTAILIGIGVIGILLIGLGIFLYLRDRARLRREDEEEISEEIIGTDALGDDRDTITDAIIALDEQYKAGEISKEAYEKRREELKGRLKELV
jgi:hypothetical protein